MEGGRPLEIRPAAALRPNICQPFAAARAHATRQRMSRPRFQALPSLAALRVFEAAGRHRSFTNAAAELCVTTSAVSRQIRALEDELGRPLFERQPRGLALTKDGAAYLAHVADALRRLDDASATLRGEGVRRKLWLSVLASFAGNWLVPRLPAFERAHPDIDVAMEATTRYVDFARDPIDLAIRFGTGPWEGLASEPLFPLEFYPVCRPERGSGRPRLRTPADLAQYTWLEEVHIPTAWPLWLRAAGVAELVPARRLTYDHAQLMLDAAMAGQGVALTSDVIAERPLRERRLVRPFAITATAPWTYHLVMRPDDRADPAIAAFRDWIVGEVASWYRQSRA
jgi:LysR family transcriptional regulator, glycine cleavage system transcriptional activator